ncbi:MAG TPA: ABC transporter substrate-binding protein [Stellaceae bacterium]|jgi:NitT/TauT family transport system substrate-binding protein
MKSPIKRRRVINRGRLLTLLGAAIAIGAAPMPSYALEPMTVGYYGSDATLAAFIAKEEGFFEKHGIDATLKQMSGVSTAAPLALVAGSVQVISASFPTAVLAAEQGLDVKILAGTTVSAPGFHIAALVRRPELDITTAKDVEGHTVGVAGINNFLHVLMVRWLGDNGADPAKVHFIEVGMPQMADLLRSGQIDAATPVEPVTTRLLSSGAGKLVAYYTDGLPAGISAYVLMIGGNYAAAHAETVVAFRAALDDGLAWYHAHPDEVDAMLVKYLRLPIEVLRASPKAPYDNKISTQQVAFWIDEMTKQKLLSQPLDPARVVVP